MKRLHHFVLLISLFSCNGPEVRLEYFENGKVKSKCEISKNQERNECEYFYDNGILQAKIIYVNGKKEGVGKFYYYNGQPSQIVTYRQGVKNGAYQLFYENGNIAERGNFYFEKKRGRVTKYHQDRKGVPSYQYLFFSYVGGSEFVSEKIEYDEAGKVIKKYNDAQLKVNDFQEVTVDIKIPYDSGSLVIGELDSLFIPSGKVDTIHFLNTKSLTYSIKALPGERLRAIWTIYHNTSDRDSLYQEMTMGLIDEPMPNH